ncbi:hypothetical protein [Streptomyces brevispora]|uniref:Uncharacterized protein n=1 Tax=Streptomyces brevispora TaxID=887462 RepID=A0A561V6A4_9ACTN|nr:hypothetical protein [Streptomyces brevispora]TWG07136.1 hypothetical protein FHX80_115640 [Streptomyces brevispora]WSC12027.1 hypothetical protein OIE64_03640 [Streptomyces brevispora]
MCTRLHGGVPSGPPRGLVRDDEKAELTQLRCDREVLLRAVNQLTMENRQVRKKTTDPNPVVQILHT